MLIRLLSYVVCLLLLVNVSGAQQIVFDSAFTSLKVRHQSYSYKDSVRIADPRRLQSLPADLWQAVGPYGFTSVQSDFAYWIKFNIESRINAPIFLEVDFPLMDSLILFVESDDQITKIEDLGDIQNVSTRYIQYRLPTFKVNLEEDRLYTFYLYGSKYKSVGVMPLTLYSEEAFIEEVVKSENAMGIVYGALIVFMIIAFLSAGYFRDWAYFYYGIFVLGLLIVVLAGLGGGHLFIWGNLHPVNSYIGYLASLISILAFGMMVKATLKLNEVYPRLNIGMNVMLIYYTLMTSLLVILYSSGVINTLFLILLRFAHFSVLVYPFYVSFVCGYVFWKSRLLKALLILVIFQISLSGMILLPLVPTGLVPRSAYGVYKWLFLLESFLLLLVLLHDLYKLKLSQIALQSKLLEEQERNKTNFLKGEQQERRRLARQLHDNLSLRLGNFKLLLSSAFGEKQPSFIHELDRISKDVRRISHALSPVTLERKGLIAALEEEIFHIESVNSDVIIEFDYPENFNEPTIEKAQVFFYSTLELLQNIQKHAQASHIHIRIQQDEEIISLTIKDDGIIYQPFTKEQGGIGLYNIQSRMEMIDGLFEIHQNESKGMIHSIKA